MTTIPSMVTTLAAGYIFDIFGRQMTLYYCILLSGVCFMLFPLFAPSTYGYYSAAIIMNLAISPLGSNPLVQDYVVKES